MKTVTYYLKEFEKLLESRNLCLAKVMDLTVNTNDYDILIVEAVFLVKDTFEGDQVYNCFSEVDMQFLEQYSEDYIIRQITGDLFLMLEDQVKQTSVIH